MKLDSSTSSALPTLEERFDGTAVRAFAQHHQITRTVARAVLDNAKTLREGALAVAKMRGQK